MIPNRYSQRTETAELDRIDWKIIEELQQDARLSWAELGRRVGLTTPAVAERVHRLEKHGVIRGFHADISLERLGMPIQIFVRLSMAGPESLVRTFQQHVKTWEEVLECHRVTGSDSLKPFSTRWDTTAPHRQPPCFRPRYCNAQSPKRSSPNSTPASKFLVP
jgi:DNA-binding Lrp family transcriptional regulator